MTSRLAPIVVVLVASAALAVAAPTSPPASERSDTEILVPPQGGTATVPVHVGAVCILSFPELISGRLALVSSDDFEIKRWGEKEVAVRPLRANAKPTTLAIATNSDALKVNVTLTAVAPDKPAVTYVRFRAVTAEEAFTAQVDAAVEKRVGALEIEIFGLRNNLEELTKERAESLIAERMVQRNETFALSAHERSNEHVIVHVSRGSMLGTDGYLTMSIENRSSDLFRVASIRVVVGTQDVTGAVHLVAGVSQLEGTLGVVPAGGTSQGVVVVRSVDKLLGQPLSLVVTGPAGSQPIRVDRGIVFR